MKTSKLLALVLALALLLSVCSFSSAEGNLSEPGTLPIWTGDEPAVLTILMAPHEAVEDYDTNLYTLWIEESLNVDIQFQFLPATDAGDKLNIMVSTGEALPDVVNYGLNVATAKAYGDAGAFINLKPFLDAGLGVNIDAAVAAFPDWNLITSISASDGSFYGVPYIQFSPSNETKYKMWINQAWLDNLGIEVPTTTDEFYEMLLRFKNEDANGNGDPNDEIPFLTSTGYGGTAYKYLTNAFVFETDNDMFLLKDGHVSVSYIQDGWFAANDYLKKLADEGLLKKESFTYSNTDVMAVLATDDDVVGATTNSSLAYVGGAGSDTYKYRLRYICLNPLTGPEGVCYSGYTQTSPTQCWFVTSFASDPELAFRAGDFQFTEEGFLRARFAIEGEHWAYADDYVKDNPGVTVAARYGSMGYEGKYVFFNDPWWWATQNANWRMNSPTFSGNVEAEGAYIADDGQGNLINLENDCTTRQETGSGYYQLCKPGMDVYVPTLSYTDEELEQIAEPLSTIRSYVNEQRTNYIIGEASDIANPEQFIQTLKDSFQLDLILEIADAAYQRQYAGK